MIDYQAGIDPNARLCDKPKSLHFLWMEYTVGIGKNKPAKDFTPSESNHDCNQNKYNMRCAFGDKVASLTTSGLHHQSIVDKIDQLYKKQDCKNNLERLQRLKQDLVCSI